MFARNYYDPTHPVHYPIHNNSGSSAGTVVINSTQQESGLYEINRKILVRYALVALADKKLLSGKRIAKSEFADASDPDPEKTYTYQVYGEDLNHRYGNRVMFANLDELNTLVRFLEKKVGEVGMRRFHRNISSNELDIVEKTAQEWVAKWRNGEEWPLD